MNKTNTLKLNGKEVRTNIVYTVVTDEELQEEIKQARMSIPKLYVFQYTQIGGDTSFDWVAVFNEDKAEDEFWLNICKDTRLKKADAIEEFVIDDWREITRAGAFRVELVLEDK